MLLEAWQDSRLHLFAVQLVWRLKKSLSSKALWRAEVLIPFILSRLAFKQVTQFLWFQQKSMAIYGSSKKARMLSSITLSYGYSWACIRLSQQNVFSPELMLNVSERFHAGLKQSLQLGELSRAEEGYGKELGYIIINYTPPFRVEPGQHVAVGSKPCEIHSLGCWTEQRSLSVKFFGLHGASNVHVSSLAGGQRGCQEVYGAISWGVFHVGVQFAACRSMKEE